MNIYMKSLILLRFKFYFALGDIYAGTRPITAQIEETSTDTETQSAATEEIAATSQNILEEIQHFADISRVSSFEEATKSEKLLPK